MEGKGVSLWFSKRQSVSEGGSGDAPGPSIRSGRWTTQTSLLTTRSALRRLPEPTTWALRTWRRPPNGLGAIDAGQLLGTRRLNSKLQWRGAGQRPTRWMAERRRARREDERVDALDELDVLEAGDVGE